MMTMLGYDVIEYVNTDDILGKSGNICYLKWVTSFKVAIDVEQCLHGCCNVQLFRRTEIAINTRNKAAKRSCHNLYQR